MAYEHTFSKSLTSTLNSKVGGSLKDGLLGLFKDPLDALCAKLKGATDGMGCNEQTVTRILGGNDKPYVRLIAARYKEKYDADLRTVIKNETGSSYQLALLTWLEVPDPTNGFTEGSTGTVVAEIDKVIRCIWDIREHIAVLDYELLKKAAVGMGTNEKIVVNVLCRRTKSHLNVIDDIFRDRDQKSLRDYISKEMGGDLMDFLEYTQMEEVFVLQILD